MRVATVYQKGSGMVNEDALLARGNLFVVVDGASSIVPWKNKKGETGGFLAARIVKHTFSSGRGTLRANLARANKEIAEQMECQQVDAKKKENRWCAAVAAVRLRGSAGEFISIADCLVLLIFKNYICKLLVNDYDHDQETLHKWRLYARQ